MKEIVVFKISVDISVPEYERLALTDMLIAAMMRVIASNENKTGIGINIEVIGSK